MEIKEFVINNTPIYQLQTKKFNTNLFGFSFVLPLSSEYLPELTLLAQIYTKQTKEFKTEREFSLRLNELYDSQIFYNFEKKGKVLQISFYLHIISDKFLKNTNNFVNDVFNDAGIKLIHIKTNTSYEKEIKMKINVNNCDIALTAGTQK